ncbi:hypothetical protein [Haliangium sp.]|uniref:hypothetical protein n=1 Tax=Haliangium sp. TaxID=2663208 RepID=UPI003D1298F6
MGRRRAYRDSLTGLEGSLYDLALGKLLDICRYQRLTGTVRLLSWGRRGHVRVRAGVVEEAAFGGLEGERAVAEMGTLRDGTFELEQELPELVRSPRCDGSTGRRLSLREVMEQCQAGSLSCRLRAQHGRQQASLRYRAGKLEQVEIDGVAHDPAAASMLAHFGNSPVRVEPLSFSIRTPVTVRSGELTERVPSPTRRSTGRPATPPPRPRVQPPMVPAAARRPRLPPRRVPGMAHPESPALEGERVPSSEQLQPWMGRPGTSGSSAFPRGMLSSRPRDLAVFGLLALFIVSLVLVIGFVAFRL